MMTGLHGWKFSVFWLNSVFLAKVQTVLEICVNLMSFTGREVYIFDKEIKSFERILICLIKSCWFLYQSPIYLWNVSMLVSINTPKSPSSFSSLYDPHRWQYDQHLIVENVQYLSKKLFHPWVSHQDHQNPYAWLWVRAMVFNATFNNISVISWLSVLLV